MCEILCKMVLTHATRPHIFVQVTQENDLMHNISDVDHLLDICVVQQELICCQLLHDLLSFSFNLFGFRVTDTYLVTAFFLCLEILIAKMS